MERFYGESLEDIQTGEFEIEEAVMTADADVDFETESKRNAIDLNFTYLDREEIKQAAAELIAGVLEGDDDALKLFVKIKAANEATSIALKNPQFQSAVMDQIDLYPADQRKIQGAEFTTRGGRAKYDFSGVESWNELKKQEKEIKDQVKKTETALIAQYEANITNFDRDTGEVMEVKKEHDGGRYISISFK